MDRWLTENRLKLHSRGRPAAADSQEQRELAETLLFYAKRKDQKKFTTCLGRIKTITADHFMQIQNWFLHSPSPLEYYYFPFIHRCAAKVIDLAGPASSLIEDGSPRALIMFHYILDRNIHFNKGNLLAKSIRENKDDFARALVKFGVRLTENQVDNLTKIKCKPALIKACQ